MSFQTGKGITGEEMRKTRDTRLRRQEGTSRFVESGALSLSAWICSLISLVTIGTLVIPDEVYADLKEGLVSVWRFDEGKGDVAHDSISNNDGDIDGAEWVEGKFGMALDFDGIDDGVTVPDHPSLQLPDALTVACWIYPRATIDHAGVCWKGEMVGWGTNFNFRIATVPGGLTWGTTAAGEDWFATSTALPDMEEWYFVCLTADGSEAIARVAKEGAALEIPESAEGNPKVGGSPYNVWEGQPVRIGWSQGRGGDLAVTDFYDGIIDEVVLYNRALSEDELTDLMNQGMPVTAVEPVGKLATTWASIKK